MIRKVSLVIMIILMAVLGSALVINAQEEAGTISGTVYRTTNASGTCTEDGLPGEPGVPLQFVNRDEELTINQSASGDGSYEFSASTEGIWQVTVNPGQGWRVLTQQTRQVENTEANSDHEEIDFCIIRVTEAPTPTAVPPTQPTPIPPVLPESGAAVAPTLLLAAGLGFLFLFAGGWLFVYSRSR